jgi:hypothetical protein
MIGYGNQVGCSHATCRPLHQQARAELIQQGRTTICRWLNRQRIDVPSRRRSSERWPVLWFCRMTRSSWLGAALWRRGKLANRLSLTLSPSTMARRRGPELWMTRPHMASYIFSRQSPTAKPPAITRAAMLTHIGISVPAMVASHRSTKRSRCMRATIAR